MQHQILDALGTKHFIDENDLIDRIAVYGVFCKDNSVLMAQDSRSHKWEFPGGGVDSGENELTALTREFQEETGLKIFPTNFDLNPPFWQTQELFFDLTSNEAWRTQRKFILVKAVTGELQTRGNGEDVIKAEFIKIIDLADKPMSETVRQVIRKMAAR